MKKSTGLSSRMAALSRPLQSAAFDGITTLMPGLCTNQASLLWLCCAPTPQPEPVIARVTSGKENWPPDRKRSLPALLTSGSIA